MDKSGQTQHQLSENELIISSFSQTAAAKSVRGIIVLGDRRGDKKGSELRCRPKQSSFPVL